MPAPRLPTIARSSVIGLQPARSPDERKIMTAKQVLSTLEMRDFAERLIAYEDWRANGSDSAVPVAFPVCEKLRPHLANLMGTIGFRALLLRALARAEAELPVMHTMHVREDGSLALRESSVDPHEFDLGNEVVVAELLGLLVDFIGEKLTLRILCEVWPTLALNELNLYWTEKIPK